MAKRINKIQEFLDEKDIDALLIKSKTVKKWMNTMTGSGCQVLITKEHGYLIVDGRYITEAKEKEHDLEIILHNPHLTGRNYLGTVEEILKKDVDVNIGKLNVTTDEYGYSDSELVVTVTNKSKEKKSFTIHIEAVDNTGKRIDDDYVYANDLNSGQTQDFKIFTLVSSEKLEQMKSAEFKIIDVSMD